MKRAIILGIFLAVTGGFFGAASEAEAGAGGLSDEYTILAGETLFYTITFRGGEMASVTLIGDGYTDIDCFVYDAYGNEVGRDLEYDDVCMIDWTPGWTGEYEIKVVNLGNDFNEYVLSTN